MGWQTVRGGSTSRTRADEMRRAADDVAHSLRVEGLAGPAEAYQVIGYLGMLTETTHEVMSAVGAWLDDAQQDGVLTVREGPFVDEPEAALAVVADALAHASAAFDRARTELERAQIAAADIGAAPHPRSRSGRWRP